MPLPLLQSDGTEVACAICGSRETRHLYEKSGYGIAACAGCGLVYANPRAPEAKILARYSRDYFWNEYLPSLGAAEGTLRSRAVRPPACSALAHDGGARAGQAPARSGVRCRLLPEDRRARRLAGRGDRALGRGLPFRQRAPELPIRRERAEDAPIAPGSFDAAAMFDVIEHLFDPRSVLTAIARALVPGGLMVISTPNYDSASRHLLGVDWAVLSPLEHVYYFTEVSLRRLLDATGFSDVQFIRQHVMWGPQETINFRYTHAPDGFRARTTEALVRAGWDAAWRGRCNARAARTRCSASRAGATRETS